MGALGAITDLTAPGSPEALAQWLGLRRDEIHIETGHGSRDKVIAFAGISAERLREKLTGLLEADRT